MKKVIKIYKFVIYLLENVLNIEKELQKILIFVTSFAHLVKLLSMIYSTISFHGAGLEFLALAYLEYLNDFLSMKTVF